MGRTPEGDIIVNSQEVIARDLQKRQQPTHYYTITYRTSGTPYKTLTITETAVPFVPPPDTISPITATLYYPTCHVFDCGWGYSYDFSSFRTISVNFAEISPPVTLTVTSTISAPQRNNPTTLVNNNTCKYPDYVMSNDSSNLYPSDVKYVVLGTVGGAIVGILSGIALSFGYYKLKLQDDGIPTPSSHSRF
ncbi:24629_t:CDS:2 [Cetraspora pellucida]|uniref:24629_t:CDS:1 n=1 Tax=Cetraspora pellucida TaxID=1433469 RepID=A0A9N9DP78_9GLOM|nr:24629_t:CDS:2 [Cetraspora pellucida]